MNEQTQTIDLTNLNGVVTDYPAEPFTICRDGEIDTEYLPHAPSLPERFTGAVSRLAGEVALQTRMAVFDARFGTNYRVIRNQLKAEKRRERFAQSVGLISLTGKY